MLHLCLYANWYHIAFKAWHRQDVRVPTGGAWIPLIGDCTAMSYHLGRSDHFAGEVVLALLTHGISV
jgi:hypothetical protein